MNNAKGAAIGLDKPGENDCQNDIDGRYYYQFDGKRFARRSL
jgi:hypothetical protein